MARSMFSLFTLLACSVPAIYGASTGEFDVLAFNVAGLPPIFNDNGVPGDKATNSRTIGAKFAEYGHDVIHVQEDFNFHDELYSADNHPYRTPHSGPAAIGSGLNTLSNFPYIDFKRIKWDECSNDSSADCLTPKGFSFMRVIVTPGVYVDFYNIHADAGTTETDTTARASNLAQVAAYIEKWSTGNAVVLFGDTNSRYTRVGDVATIFNTRNGMRDPWVELIHGGVAPTVETVCPNPATSNDCEIVDKIFYRGSRSLVLKATEFSYESSKFLQADGSILSDHNPVRANFSWAVSDSFQQSDLLGGPHGDWFNDLDALPESAKPSKIKFSGAKRLDSVGLVLADGAELTHGGSGGTPASLDLGADEFWTQTTWCQDKYDKVFTSETRIFFIEAVTSKGRKLASGTRRGTCVTRDAPSGWQISGFFGRSGDEIDRLGFIYTKQ